MKAQDEQEEPVEDGWMDPESFYADPNALIVGPPSAEPYATTHHISKAVAKTKPVEIDFIKTAKLWESHPKIANKAVLRAGCVVGWWVSAHFPFVRLLFSLSNGPFSFRGLELIHKRLHPRTF